MDMTPTTEWNELMQEEKIFFTVAHPLDDGPEEKVDTEHLALRGYLQLAGIVRP